jgi:hypothetical protein
VLDEALDRRIFTRPGRPLRDLVALVRRQDLTDGHIKKAMLAAVATAVAEHPEAPVLDREPP